MFSLSVTLEVFPEFPLCICTCVSWRFINCWTGRRDLAASPSSFLGAHLSGWGIQIFISSPPHTPFPLSCTQFHLISSTFKTGLQRLPPSKTGRSLNAQLEVELESLSCASLLYLVLSYCRPSTWVWGLRRETLRSRDEDWSGGTRWLPWLIMMSWVLWSHKVFGSLIGINRIKHSVPSFWFILTFMVFL